ncbi:MAG: PilZ domain-containing protein [Pyrinomonadaceae bacterium]|nr:PilZ domain-containing protein [Pyrinomonadaceae bacterium]
MKTPVPSSYDERRRFPRIKILIDVDLGETPACVHKGRVTSLSLGGCFIQTTLEIAKGKPVFIRLMLAPGSSRVIEGIVWGRVAYHFPKVGLGIEFKKLPPGYERHINDLVEFYLGGEATEDNAEAER